MLNRKAGVGQKAYALLLTLVVLTPAVVEACCCPGYGFGPYCATWGGGCVTCCHDECVAAYPSVPNTPDCQGYTWQMCIVECGTGCTYYCP